MSVRIVRASLTKEVQDEIALSLEFSPTNRYMAKKRTYSKSSVPVVKCYKYDNNNAFIRFPLMYCINKWGISNNRGCPHAAINVQQTRPLYDWQLPIVSDASDELIKNKATLIKSMPGSGKTVMACVLITLFKLRTVILIENLELSGQWMKTVDGFTTCTAWMSNNNGCPPNYPDVIVCHAQRWQHMPDDLRDSIGFLIVDECPLFCNQRGIDCMLAFSPQYILALSATPSRSRDSMFVTMEQFIGKSMVEFKDKLPIDVVKVMTEFTLDRPSKDTSWTTIVQGLYYNEDRNKLLVNIAKNRVEAGYKVIMLANEKKHVSMLSEMLREQGMNHDTYSGNKKAYFDTPILVANIKKASVGFDEGGMSCIGFDSTRISCVIFCVSVANAEGIIQGAGRGFRSSLIKPCIVHIVDDDKSLKDHFRTALAAYKEYDYEVTLTEW